MRKKHFKGNKLRLTVTDTLVFDYNYPMEGWCVLGLREKDPCVLFACDTKTIKLSNDELYRTSIIDSIDLEKMEIKTHLKTYKVEILK
jgi:pantothenate kinase-related protein Tda10